MRVGLEWKVETRRVNSVEALPVGYVKESVLGETSERRNFSEDRS